MNRYHVARGAFILLIGTTLPLLADIVSARHTLPDIILAQAYYILIYLLSWVVCIQLTGRVKRSYSSYAHPFLKMSLLCLCSALVTVVVVYLATVGYFSLRQEPAGISVELMVSFSLAASTVFTLMFEVAHLTDEWRQEHRLALRLDRKWQKAQINALRNELDPHFMFNALTNLSSLIRAGASDRAVEFNDRLAQVYRYILVNKNKNLIPLQQELDFIRDYFFLLSIRFEGKVVLEVDTGMLDTEHTSIVPCALQIPLENAVKHNELSARHPLVVRIVWDGVALNVINELRPKLYVVNSTHIGLDNLRSRYQLACQKQIEVKKSDSLFIVKLPLVA